MRLVMTCSACPEQYDAYEGNVKVGYLRLRHGYFEAEAFDRVVYAANTYGDGMFENHERKQHLDAAVAAIAVAIYSVD